MPFVEVQVRHGKMLKDKITPACVIVVATSDLQPHSFLPLSVSAAFLEPLCSCGNFGVHSEMHAHPFVSVM